MSTARFDKLIHIVRHDGIRTAARETAGYVRKTIKNTITGVPGHYRIQYLFLTRRCDPRNITPQWISPSDISFLTGEYSQLDRGHLDYTPYFKPENGGSALMSYEQEIPYGSTVSGDWDMHREPFSKLLIYRGIRQHYSYEIPWAETVYFKRLVDRFCNQGMKTSSAEALATNRCNHIDSVYRAIKTQGYQSQRELRGHPLHEVTVNIARDGAILYNSEGRHRLSIAKILDIDKIPVLVLAKHPSHETNSANSVCSG